MNKLLYEFGSAKNYPILEQRMKARQGMFKKILTPKQYRQLQRLLSDAETIEGERLYENFKCGIKFAFTLMATVYFNDDNYDG